MVTASHNPPQYNGMKLVGEGALPLSGDAGIPELKQRSQALSELPAAAGGHSLEVMDLYPAYVRHLHGLVDPSAFAPYRVIMDAANGVGGKLAPLVFDGTPISRIEMYFEVDGTFPNHEPNPLLEENSREIRERVLAEKADLGIAWDGDADRCFFIDENGEFVPGDFVTALLAEALLIKNPGASILYDLRASRAVPDVIIANGGVPLLNRVGHAFFKQRMRREGGLFGGEVSGHYYFADNYNADSGFIPALLILDLLSRKKATMAELLEPLRSTYFISGEINSTVSDVPAALARIEERFVDGEITHLDGVSVDYEHWHFNVRASNTEPLLRLNLGADSEALMEEKRDLVLASSTKADHGERDGRHAADAAEGADIEELPDHGLAADRVSALDADDMLGAIAGLPRQLTAGYAVASDVLAGALDTGGPDGLRGVALCGMGGSAIGADLVLACVPDLRVPGRRRAWLPPAGLGRARGSRAGGQLLRRHRGDAGLRDHRPRAGRQAGVRGLGRQAGGGCPRQRPASGAGARRGAASRCRGVPLDAAAGRAGGGRPGRRRPRAGGRGRGAAARRQRGVRAAATGRG